MIKLYVFVTSLTDELKSLNGENFLPPVPPKHLDFMLHGHLDSKLILFQKNGKNERNTNFKANQSIKLLFNCYYLKNINYYDV